MDHTHLSWLHITSAMSHLLYVGGYPTRNIQLNCAALVQPRSFRATFIDSVSSHKAAYMWIETRFAALEPRPLLGSLQA